MNEIFNCPVCNESEWKDIDECRNHKAGMIICTSCGFVTYERAKDEVALKEYYEKEYKAAGPQANNIITCNRKINYVMPYLMPLFEKWAKQEHLKINILDHGCALGYLLVLAKSFLPKAEIYGTEWMQAFRRAAYYYNKQFSNIELMATENINETIKYRLIISNHVHEHVVNPDKKAKKFNDLLIDTDSYLFMSVPIWDKIFDNWDGSGIYGTSAMPGVDYHYHPDHINVWNKNQFMHLISKAGFKCIKSDDYYYGYSGLYEKGNEVVPLVKQDWREVADKIIKRREAVKLLVQNKIDEALQLEPYFPEAYLKAIMQKFNGKKDLQFEMINKALEIMPNYYKILNIKATLHAQYRELNEAIATINEVLKVKPNNEASMHETAMIQKSIGNFKGSIEPLLRILQLDNARYVEIMSELLHSWSQIPTPNEQKIIKKTNEFADTEIKKAKEANLI